ncbi:hypothetical protein SAMN05216474_1617 [Lishizhenia tianjinensis]|uniref:DUF4190 domain-containing protein n=1 Tax=Lishizhenia tianjinensis TaxID=477690 RepID=A0A1I6ZU00_9FLAO|nr:hypothetical protein [Lishizhenia tianjinensis]SFT66107.1 hypothetical protein SAMN05216474_1617 [Lishizhenia tianjinensis]
MKTLNIVTVLIFSILLVSCATTPEFNKRKYTKGRFRIPHNLKKHNAKSDEKDELNIIHEIKREENGSKDLKILHSSKKTTIPNKTEQRKREVEFTVEGVTDAKREARRIEFEKDSKKKVSSKEDVISELINELNDSEEPQKNKTESRANLALVFGLLSWAGFFYPLFFLFSFVGFIFGIFTLTATDYTKKDRNRALFGIVTFILLTLVFSFFLIKLLWIDAFFIF